MASPLPAVVFNKPACVGTELGYVKDAVLGKFGISGNGYYLEQCERWFKEHVDCERVLLTGSCTHALEIAALLLDLKPGDEIIMPSFTFVTTANAFVLHGGTPVFVDIRPDTMNIDEMLIEAAITPRTRAIVVMHYAGVGCHMEPIVEIARRHKLVLIEDAAQGVFSYWQGKALGSFGDFSTFSFHETKNYTAGEGGALVINDAQWCARAEIIRQKGTNREAMLRGQVDKYTWVDIGSSYVMSELNAAYLWGQLEAAKTIDHRRFTLWTSYMQGLQVLEEAGHIERPFIPDGASHNSHLFYIKVRDVEQRTRLIAYLKQEHNIHAVFHYVPLHSSPAGKRYGRMHGEDVYTTRESERLVRLPLYYNLMPEEAQRVIEAVKNFFLQA